MSKNASCIVLLNNMALYIKIVFAEKTYLYFAAEFSNEPHQKQLHIKSELQNLRSLTMPLLP